MGDFNFRWLELLIVFNQQKNKLNLNSRWFGNFRALINETAERKQSAIPLSES